MLPQLKQNIVTIAKQKGWKLANLQKKSGLRVNCINNIIYGRSNNPGIESIIKIADTLGVSVDELLGKTPKLNTHDLLISRKDIFAEAINYLLVATNNKPTIYKYEDFFKAVYDLYDYSIKKGSFDKEFAEWFVRNQFYYGQSL